MPELPEVETTRLGIQKHILQQTVATVIVRETRLRWPVPSEITTLLPAQTIRQINRRGKYLLLNTLTGTVIIHLGMSGNLRILNLSEKTAVKKHDHLDMVFTNGTCLRFNDPRRFGCFLWTDGDPHQHFLLKDLGPEPFSSQFDGDYLYEISRKRNVPIKNFIMDSRIVVGVGNIYANEALFYAGIAPQAPAGKINAAQYHRLAEIIKIILKKAIEIGGTTLRNFINSDGAPGYFKQQLKVYGRAGLACASCKTTLIEIRLGQRSSVYCPNCQQI